MGIYIPGMEMPDYGYVCLKVFANGEVLMTKEHRGALVITGINDKVGTAVPVPPHGDLVDRDEMFAEFVVEGQKTTRYKVGERWELNGEEIRRVIQRLPTIVQAEKGET